MKNPIVTIEMENGNKMKVELYPGYRPEHCEKFCIAGEEGIL